MNKQLLRAVLPGRRITRTTKASLDGHRLHVAVGFARPARDALPCALEVFIAGPGKAGSARNLELDDAAVLVSFMLQLGVRPRTLRARLGEDPARPGAALSAIAVALDAVIAVEAEFLAEWTAGQKELEGAS